MDFLNKHLRKLATDNQDKRFKSHGNMFTASDTGLCVGRSWHRREETEQKLPDDKSLMMMKLGDLVHKIVQNAAWSTNPENTLIEFFMKDKELNVCGSLDLYLKEEKHLIDIKSIKTYRYTKLFGKKKNRDSKAAEHNRMQLGTYAMMLKEAGYPVEKITLLYVDRNDGRIGEKDVSLDFIKYAQAYWETINMEMEYGPDDFENHHMLPVYDWECNYCSFSNNCKWRKEKNAKK